MPKLDLSWDIIPRLWTSWVSLLPYGPIAPMCSADEILLTLLTTGTDQFQYASVKYSGAQKAPSFWKIEKKWEIGFSQWGSGTGALALGKYDGYKTQRPDNYDAILDEASSIPVIIYDTRSSQATQANAEDLILHILLHRQRRHPAVANKNTCNPVDVIKCATSDRRLTSTRETMKLNAEKVIGYHTQLGKAGDKAVFFKDEANRLYTTLDALWDRSREPSASDFWKINFSQHQVIGWEYMALIDQSIKYLAPKSIKQGGTGSGGWLGYAKDVRAVNLFVNGFGDIYAPSNPGSLCSRCLSLPKDNGALAIRVGAILRLFEQQGCQQTRARLTENGWTIQADEDPFRHCEWYCRGSRVVDLVQRPAQGTSHFVHKLPEDGVILVGRTAQSTWKRILSRALFQRQ